MVALISKNTFAGIERIGRQNLTKIVWKCLSKKEEDNKNLKIGRLWVSLSIFLLMVVMQKNFTKYSCSVILDKKNKSINYEEKENKAMEVCCINSNNSICFCSLPVPIN